MRVRRGGAACRPGRQATPPYLITRGRRCLPSYRSRRRRLPSYRSGRRRLPSYRNQLFLSSLCFSLLPEVAIVSQVNVCDYFFIFYSKIFVFLFINDTKWYYLFKKKRIHCLRGFCHLFNVFNSFH